RRPLQRRGRRRRRASNACDGGGRVDAMRADIVEITWQRRLALRAIACALSELKCLAAETRLERAMRRHALALKYGYNPAQPRVPKGNEDGGQWTETDANGNPLSEKPGRDDLIRIAG